MELMPFDSVSNEEVLAADIDFKVDSSVTSLKKDYIDSELQRVNLELDNYVNHADKTDYAVSVASGVFAGLIDSFFVGEFSLDEAHEWGSDKTEKFVVKVAKNQGYQGDDVKEAIKYLAEDKKHKDASVKSGFHLAADTNTNDFGGGRQHHLRDFAHHPTVFGLCFSVLTQFTKKSYGTDVHGNFIVVDVKDNQFIGKSTSQKLEFGIIYWFFHLISDVAGSGIPDSEGTGIPGPFLSLAKMISATPLFNKTNENGHKEFSVFISKLFNGTFFGERDENGKLIPLRFDYRTEIGIGHYIGKQFVPVMINESIVRSYFFFSRLYDEITKHSIKSFKDLEFIDWSKTKPFGNRTIDRMLTIAAITFNIADTADAAVRAAVESGGNWVIFSGKFVTRYNFVGASRVALAVVKEVSDESKEAQLVHEKMLLSLAKTQISISELNEFKRLLNEKVSTYLAEDITQFLEGFTYISYGFNNNDSNMVIKGNVTIQRVLGREPQFSSQEEFDDLMESDIPLQL